MTTKQRPVHVVKMGLMEAAIWRHGEEKKPYFNVTLRRHYAVETSGNREWRTTDSFGRNDLLLGAKLLDLAHTWVSEQMTVRARTEADRSEE